MANGWNLDEVIAAAGGAIVLFGKFRKDSCIETIGLLGVREDSAISSTENLQNREIHVQLR